MTDSRETEPGDQNDQPNRPRAVVYYRQSTQDRQDNPIHVQREQVREWAEKNGLEVIEEFADPAQSGPTADSPP
jgi:DNA invertase Pin-like site-specific DNA recombinase